LPVNMTKASKNHPQTLRKYPLEATYPLLSVSTPQKTRLL
jgi:hypothetical protein